MDWQQILGFYWIAKLGSFTEAAKATFRTQSALSQQIKKLEQELKTPLLERVGKRRLALTPAGEKFFQFAKAVLELYDGLKEDLNRIHKGKIGRLRIAGQFAALYYLLPKVVSKYLTLFPGVDLYLVDCPLQQVINLVRSGDIDIGIGLESSVPNDLHTIRLWEANFVLVVPQDHPLTRSKTITIEQIAQYPLILPSRRLGSLTTNPLEKMFEKRGIKYKVVMEASTIELGSKYVELGLGISIAPSGFGLETVKGRKVELIPIPELFPADYICIIKRMDKKLQFYADAFVKLLLESKE